MMLRQDLEQLKASVHADAETWSWSDEDRVLAQFVEVSGAVATEATEG